MAQYIALNRNVPSYDAHAGLAYICMYVTRGGKYVTFHLLSETVAS